MEFTVARIKDGRADFSFSGIKTAVLLHVRREGIPPVADPADVPDARAGPRGLVPAGGGRPRSCAGSCGPPASDRPRSLILTGGVAANTPPARARPSGPARELGLPVFIPPLALTTDNAAMIAAAGFVAFRRGARGDLALNAEPHLPLG